MTSLRVLKAVTVYAFLVVIGARLAFPITAVAGLAGMALAKRSGNSAFVLGLLCFALSAGNFLLWTKYGSMPFKIPFCDWCNHS